MKNPVEELLKILVPNQEAAAAWLKTPSEILGGKTPEELIRDGRESEVADYLRGIGYGNFQ